MECPFGLILGCWPPPLQPVSHSHLVRELTAAICLEEFHSVGPCLERRARPIVGQALIGEYEDVLARTALFSGCPLTAVERNQLLNAFLSVSEWVKDYYSWRPNLRDEADNHLIELAVAGGADMIVSNNVRHLTAGELQFPEIRILRPKEFLQQL